MFVEEKLKLNRFQHVSIPSNSDLWQRSGCALVVPGSSQFSGEGEPVPGVLRKSDIFHRAMSEEMNEIRREAAEERDRQQEEQEEG